MELRKAGYEIRTEKASQGAYIYTLVSGPGVPTPALVGVVDADGESGDSRGVDQGVEDSGLPPGPDGGGGGWPPPDTNGDSAGAEFPSPPGPAGAPSLFDDDIGRRDPGHDQDLEEAA
jgi:hypothetical protein